jgi:hypothetical protein
MKAIVKALIIISLAQTTNAQDKISLLGSWMLNINDGLPEHIIFRTDSSYVIYVPGGRSGNRIKARDGSEMTMIETGKWLLQSESKELCLEDRNIIDQSSDFSDTYGRTKKIVLYVKDLTRDSFSLCKMLSEIECDEYTSYSKYSTYKEFSISYHGSDSKIENLSLSGYETKIDLISKFETGSGVIAIEDQNGKAILNNFEISSKPKSLSINIRGLTKITVKINSIRPNSKWRVQIKVL